MAQIEQLTTATTRDEARAALAGLTVTQIRKIYMIVLASLPASPFISTPVGRTKRELTTNLVELVIGRRLDSLAIERAVQG